MGKVNKNNRKKENLNGEFIPTFHSWISLEKQKENAEKLEKITENKDKEKED